MCKRVEESDCKMFVLSEEPLLGISEEEQSQKHALSLRVNSCLIKTVPCCSLCGVLSLKSV